MKRARETSPEASTAQVHAKKPKREEYAAEVEAVPPGDFEEHYKTLRSIGQGASGFVKLARRRWDGTEVRGKNKIINCTVFLGQQ